MNRKNLTAAVLAGLAGVAGMAGAVQADVDAVNLNPDGLGEVLIYPYYTTNDDNTTLVTVVNTTSAAKAVKVRFLEGFNSREVLDFNLYLSPWDVWVAAVADSAAFGAAAGVPHIFIPDTSCTVPYLYEDAYNEDLGGGLQAFLKYAYTGDNEDGGPTDISRTSEGYLEIIEMGVMVGGDGDSSTKTPRLASDEAATHELMEDDDGNEYSAPADCNVLVENWTEYSGVKKPHPFAGLWLEEAVSNCGETSVDDIDPADVGVGTCGQENGALSENEGGLFGGAAIINVPKGTMFSYDAKALQGFDTSSDGIHFYPGTIHPSLNDGNVKNAAVFVGQGEIKTLAYGRSVDAVSAVFMHDTLSNTFVIDEEIAAATEWVMTFPTKAWFVDTNLNNTAYSYYYPDEDDEVGCHGWSDGDPNPYQSTENGGEYGFACAKGENEASGGTGAGFDDWAPGCTLPNYGLYDWQFCDVVKSTETDSVAPFTTTFDGDACEEVYFEDWDREESPRAPGGGSVTPPIVSPAPPPGDAPPGAAPFELCYEVNVLRFGEREVFGTDSDLLYTVEGTPSEGWARITFGGKDGDCVACTKTGYELHKDEKGLRGLPVTGFSAEQYTNGELAGGVLANYGGLFSHKGSVLCLEGGATDNCLSAAEEK